MPMHALLIHLLLNIRRPLQERKGVAAGDPLRLPAARRQSQISVAR